MKRRRTALDNVTGGLWVFAVETVLVAIAIVSSIAVAAIALLVF